MEKTIVGEGLDRPHTIPRGDAFWGRCGHRPLQHCYRCDVLVGAVIDRLPCLPLMREVARRAGVRENVSGFLSPSHRLSAATAPSSEGAEMGLS